MAFPDFEFNEALPSYPHRDDVMDYLAQYAATFDVMKYIKVWYDFQGTLGLHPI